MTNRIRSGVVLGALAIALGNPINSYAVSVQSHGQVGLVGDYFNPVIPNGSTLQTVRAPLGLTLEIRPANNLAVFFDLRLGVNNYPYLARDLGNNQNANTTESALPFSVDGGRGERFESPKVGFAYVEYAASEVGLFRVGRVPRHWGLGLWRNDGGVNPSISNREWIPEGGTFSVTDGISAIIDFRTVYFGAHWEKNYEGVASSSKDDAESWTADIVVGESPTEIGQSGFGREVGIAYSRFSDNKTSTTLSIIDLYSRLQYDSLLGEGELLYPSGSSQSASYADMGGSGVCTGDAGKVAANLMCSKEKVDAMAALLKIKYLFSSGSTPNSTSGISQDGSQKRGIPSIKRRESHTAGGWLGYTSGDGDAFTRGASASNSNKINLGVMHPNIRPSLMMFNAAMPDIPGMPGGMVRNSVFVRAEYVYENPSAGTLTPAIIWGSLQSSAPAALQNVRGRYKDLGIELNVNYAYTTTDYVKLSADAGFWMPGTAWATTGAARPGYCLGARLMVSTIFH